MIDERLARQRDEAWARAMHEVKGHLANIGRAVEQRNYGIARDGLDALRDEVETEFGTPLIFDKHLAAVQGRPFA